MDLYFYYLIFDIQLRCSKSYFFYFLTLWPTDLWPISRRLSTIRKSPAGLTSIYNIKPLKFSWVATISKWIVTIRTLPTSLRGYRTIITIPPFSNFFHIKISFIANPLTKSRATNWSCFWPPQAIKTPLVVIHKSFSKISMSFIQKRIVSGPLSATKARNWKEDNTFIWKTRR